MRQIVLITALLVGCAAPALAEEFKWLTEDQFQTMSVDELQAWAKKADKNLARKSLFKRNKEQIAQVATTKENTTIELRKEIITPASSTTSSSTSTTAKDPNDINKSYFAKPKYVRETIGDVGGGVMKVVGSPFSLTGKMLKGTFKGMEKVMWFLDEKLVWL